jgi:DNA polymerase V
MSTYNGGNTTGFVSPAGDSLEGRIDLTHMLDLSRPSRYPVRILGDALASRGIKSGDILVVDAALPPVAGKVAVVMMQGAVLVGQLILRQGQWWLLSGRPDVQPVPVAGDEAEIWAVVTGLVRADVYVREDYARRVIEAAGFRLAGVSGIGDNPRDTKVYPKGVWTLPPVLAMGDVDRAKYLAIGESDRWTMKFVKI